VHISFHYSRTIRQILTNEGENRIIMIKRRKTGEIECAVSPVVGVMLMLVVTIIIAAVVSAFSGGLVGGNNQKTPTLAMDVKIVNSSSTGTTFSATILGISDPVQTKYLKIATSWAKNITSGAVYGGNTTSTTGATAPYGFGPGITGNTTLTSPYNPNQYFGNYTLMQGTGMVAESSDISSLLGGGYGNLGVGDVVTVRVIFTPTGKTVFQKDVYITGG